MGSQPSGFPNLPSITSDVRILVDSGAAGTNPVTYNMSIAQLAAYFGFNQVALGALTLSPLTATVNATWTASISGGTTGSQFSATSSDGTPLTVSGTTIQGTFTGTGTPTIAVTETLGSANNSPRTTNFTLNVTAQQLWTPASLGSSLLAWWDASQGFNAPSGAASTWTDRIGGLVATGAQATAPSYSATARNGKPGVQFNGSQFMTFTPPAGFPSGANPGTIAVAAYVAASSAIESVFGYGTAGSGGIRYLVKNSSDNLVRFLVSGAGQSAAETWSAVDRMVISCTDGKNNTLYVDGNAAEASTASIGTPNTGLNTGTIGVYVDGSSYKLTGTVQNIFVLNRTPTASEAAKLAGWESWNDGKNGANLPSSSPYVSRAPYVSDA